MKKNFFLLSLTFISINLCAEGETPLYLAAKNGDFLKVKELVENKHDVNEANFVEDAPWGADQWYYDHAGYTPIFGALFSKNLAIVNYLIAHGADVNQGGNYYGVKSPLHAASSLPILELLLENGAYVGYEDVLKSVVQYSHNVVEFKILIRYRNQKSKNEHLLSELLIAASEANVPVNIEIFELLIHLGADVNYILEERTPLHNLASYSYDGGASGYPSRSYSASAIIDNKIKLIQILKKHGANMHVKNKNGKTALEIAQEIQIIEELKKSVS